MLYKYNIMTTQEKVKQLAEQHPEWSARKIAEQIGVTRAVVVYHYHKCGIVRDRKEMQRLNNTCRDSPITISNVAEQIILGSILGDGSISKHRESVENTKLRLNSQLTIVHGEAQKQYLLYKKELLENEGIKGYVTRKLGEKGSRLIKGIPIYSKDSFELRTIRNSSFNKYRDLFYEDKKYINEYIQKLGPLGLAIWYLDDGNLYKRTVRFYTNCFTDNGLVILQKMLKDNFDINTSIHRGPSKGKTIYIKTDSYDKFFKIINQYIPDCMKYKIDTKFRESGKVI